MAFECNVNPSPITTTEQCVLNNICDVMMESTLCEHQYGHNDPVPSITLPIPADCNFKAIVSVVANGTVRPEDADNALGYQLSGTTVLFNTPLQAQDPISCYAIICYTVECSVCKQATCP